MTWPVEMERSKNVFESWISNKAASPGHQPCLQNIQKSSFMWALSIQISVILFHKGLRHVLQQINGFPHHIVTEKLKLRIHRKGPTVQNHLFAVFLVGYILHFMLVSFSYLVPVDYQLVSLFLFLQYCNTEKGGNWQQGRRGFKESNLKANSVLKLQKNHFSYIVLADGFWGTVLALHILFFISDPTALYKY